MWQGLETLRETYENHLAKALPSVTLNKVHSASILTTNGSLPIIFCQPLGKDVVKY